MRRSRRRRDEAEARRRGEAVAGREVSEWIGDYNSTNLQSCLSGLVLVRLGMMHKINPKINNTLLMNSFMNLCYVPSHNFIFTKLPNVFGLQSTESVLSSGF